MESNHNNVTLTSAELSRLWTVYMSDSMSICVFKHFLQHIEDEEIESIVNYAIQLSEEHINFIQNLYTEEKITIPQGFTEADVNLNASRLFTDIFYLRYIKQMAKGALAAYGRFIQSMFRKDILEFLNSCLKETIELNNRATQLLLEKGLAARSPTIPYPNQVEFVHKQSFILEGLGRREGLTATEITNLHSNIQTNYLGTSLTTAFSQVACSDKVRKYFLRGKEIAVKHIKVFASYFEMASLPVPMGFDQEVTKSKEPPFSDKLMMFLVTLMIYTGIGNYGVSISESQKSDITVDYSRLIVEVLKYSEDGANIMITNGWLEQPPLSADRKDLSKS